MQSRAERIIWGVIDSQAREIIPGSPEIHLTPAPRERVRITIIDGNKEPADQTFDDEAAIRFLARLLTSRRVLMA